MINRVLAAAFTLLASAGGAQPSSPTDYDRFMPGRDAATTYSIPVARERIEYGELSGQEISFHSARGDAPAPLVVYISSIWSDGQDRGLDDDVAGFAYERGYASAFVGYHWDDRPSAEDVLADYAGALRQLAEEAPERGIDVSRIVIVARGSAAGFAALLATDPALIEASGLPFEALRGVILLNGEGFDLAPRLAESDGRLNSEFEDLFGEGTGGLTRYSPVNHLEPPNAPRFLLVAEERRGSSTAYAHAFADQLEATGIEHELVLIPRHIRSYRANVFGTRPMAAGEAAANFLEASFHR